MIDDPTCDNALCVPPGNHFDRVFGSSRDLWLSVQRRTDLWEAMHSPTECEPIQQARADRHGLKSAERSRRTIPADAQAPRKNPMSATIALS